MEKTIDLFAHFFKKKKKKKLDISLSADTSDHAGSVPKADRMSREVSSVSGVPSQQASARRLGS